MVTMKLTTSLLFILSSLLQQSVTCRITSIRIPSLVKEDENNCKQNFELCVAHFGGGEVKEILATAGQTHLGMSTQKAPLV